MERNILLELESAAKVVLAPPSLITAAQRQVAEKVFLDFRKSECPYGLCKFMLETSTVDYVLFETASCLMIAFIREYDRLPAVEVRELHKYLVNYLLGKPSLPPFVRERIIQVIAIMVKRGSGIKPKEENDFKVDRQQFLSDVEDLIMKGDFHKQLLGCSIISALIQEFNMSSKSTDVGLTLDCHHATKRDFQNRNLKRIFEMCIAALNELLKLPTPFPENALSLMKHLLAISEFVLEWDLSLLFTRCRQLFPLRQTGGVVDQVPLKRQASWSDVLLNHDVINLFFNIYWKIRDNPHLSHHALNCLVQLASLHGPVVNSKEEKSKYFSNYIQTFLNLLQSMEVLDREAQGVAVIINNLFTYCPPFIMTRLAPEIVNGFLEQCIRLTCYFAEGAAHEESLQSDDCLFMEAYETLLKIWLDITNDVQLYTENFCQHASMQIFNTYLKCHLSPPHGTRGTGRELDSEEIADSEEDDGIKFRNQLQCIGRLGRRVLSHSLPLLARLIEERTATLHSNLQRIHQNSFSIADSSLLAGIFEDLHWLNLIAGHVIAMESPGEAILIPSEILHHSVRQQASIDVTLKVLAGSQSMDAMIPESEKCDDVVRLVAAVFKLCEVERKVVEAKLIHLLSPELGKTLLWFLKHWSVPYLFIAEACYSDSEVSVALLSAFGRDTEGAQWAVNFLFRKIESSLKEFNAEPGVVESAVGLMVSLLDVRDKALCVLKSEGFWRIVDIQRQMDTRTLPSTAKIGLMRGFIAGGAGLEEKRDEYWQQILKPMLDKLRDIVVDVNFKKNCQAEEIRSEILFILESYVGVAQGVHVVTVQSLFTYYIAPVLEESSNLITIYCNYQTLVDAILDLFLKCAKSFLCYLSSRESRRFYQACLNMVQMYARSNRGRRTIDVNTEDQTYQDILLLMELFTTLQSKEYFDLSPPDQDEPDNQSTVVAADVCLYGLKVIMPLMNVELLKCSSLGVCYYGMLSSSADLHPEKILSLEAEVLQNMLTSVELGLQTFGQDEAVSCCVFIERLTAHILATGQQTVCRHLVPFLKLMLDMTLCCQVNSYVLPSVGGALLPLIMCYREDYEILVRGWVSMQNDPSVAQRLEESFDKFTKVVDSLTSFDDIRKRRRFRDEFEKFTVDLHGFLWVL